MGSLHTRLEAFKVKCSTITYTVDVIFKCQHTVGHSVWGSRVMIRGLAVKSEVC